MDTDFQNNTEGYMEDEGPQWEHVNDAGDYDDKLTNRMDLTNELEEMLTRAAVIFSRNNRGSEFLLANLVGEDNSDKWSDGPLSELRDICQDDNKAKLAAGMALKKGLFKRGGFEMTKSIDGINVYRCIEAKAYSIN